MVGGLSEAAFQVADQTRLSPGRGPLAIGVVKGHAQQTTGDVRRMSGALDKAADKLRSLTWTPLFALDTLAPSFNSHAYTWCRRAERT